ncbi:MAG: DUF839 domain-containing protein [Gammaproteobacteria bacterium]|nr:DUF839 domain-containing protein [Gammaproteobacteria bacterium]
MRKRVLVNAAVIAIGAGSSAAAVDGGPFPLPASTGVLTAGDPFLLSSGLTATLITDRHTLQARGLPATFGHWDMATFDRTSASIYVPTEVGSGAGVFRYDIQSGTFQILMKGNASGIRTTDPALFDPLDDDFAGLDPATATPFGSVLTGEERPGGRLFEISNPNADGRRVDVAFLANVPAVAHEGLRFDSHGNLYFVDEFDSGSVYRFVPRERGTLNAGQSFVLVVDAFAGNPAQAYNSAVNVTEPRAGAAHWQPLTDADGGALPGVADPFDFASKAGGGRRAADSVGGTPFGRPEDVTLTRLANGREILYFAATSEHAVYGVELVDDAVAMVRIFVDRDVIDLATGAAVGISFTHPDNLASGADGSIYIVEDQAVPDADIWRAIDADRDGVAEGVGRWISLGVPGAEATGLEQDPNDPHRFIVNIQHPTGGNDALWEIRTR